MAQTGTEKKNNLKEYLEIKFALVTSDTAETSKVKPG
jgi:hypothetical protein